MTKRILAASLLCVGLAAAWAGAGGCTSPGKKTAIGAGAGAAGGAVVGGVAGGGKGAAIGAATGAVVGGAVGNYLDKQAKELAEVADTQRTRDGILVNLKNDLLFHSGSDVLRPEAVRQLGELGEILAKYPDDRIRVEGYTDSVGGTAYNEELSQRRANAVRSVLVDHGVKPNQMFVVGHGAENPIASNQSIKGRAANRRVELHIGVPQQAGVVVHQPPNG